MTSTSMAATLVEPSSATLNKILHKINHGQKEIDENDLKELQLIASLDNSYTVRYSVTASRP